MSIVAYGFTCHILGVVGIVLSALTGHWLLGGFIGGLLIFGLSKFVETKERA